MATALLVGIVVALVASVTRCAVLVTATAVLAIVAAAPLRGITDARPSIRRMLAADEQTGATFRAAATRLALGRTTEKAMVAAASKYMRLRIESWRWRAAAFRKGSLSMLRQADAKEGAARDFLNRNQYLASFT